MAKPYSLACPFYQARDISHNERVALTHSDYSENGCQSCKMIVRYYWLCFADDRNQSRFPDIREPEQTYIGNELQLKSDLPFLARHSAFCKPWSLPCRRCKVGIAPTA